MNKNERIGLNLRKAASYLGATDEEIEAVFSSEVVSKLKEDSAKDTETRVGRAGELIAERNERLALIANAQTAAELVDYYFQFKRLGKNHDCHIIQAIENLNDSSIQSFILNDERLKKKSQKRNPDYRLEQIKQVLLQKALETGTTFQDAYELLNIVDKKDYSDKTYRQALELMLERASTADELAIYFDNGWLSRADIDTKGFGPKKLLSIARLTKNSKATETLFKLAVGKVTKYVDAKDALECLIECNIKNDDIAQKMLHIMQKSAQNERLAEVVECAFRANQTISSELYFEAIVWMSDQQILDTCRMGLYKITPKNTPQDVLLKVFNKTSNPEVHRILAENMFGDSVSIDVVTTLINESSERDHLYHAIDVVVFRGKSLLADNSAIDLFVDKIIELDMTNDWKLKNFVEAIKSPEHPSIKRLNDHFNQQLSDLEGLEQPENVVNPERKAYYFVNAVVRAKTDAALNYQLETTDVGLREVLKQAVLEKLRKFASEF